MLGLTSARETLMDQFNPLKFRDYSARGMNLLDAANQRMVDQRARWSLAELIAETKRRNRRRRAIWAIGLLALIAVIAGSLTLGYQWTQSLYYVGTDGDTVIIYRGVQQGIGSLSLSSEAEDTGIPLDSLGGLEQRQVERTLSAGSPAEAREIVLRRGVEP